MFARDNRTVVSARKQLQIVGTVLSTFLPLRFCIQSALCSVEMPVYPLEHIQGFLPRWVEPLFVLLVVIGFAFPRRPIRVFCTTLQAYVFLSAPLYHRQNLHSTFEAGIWIAVVFFAYTARFFLTDPNSEHGQLQLDKNASSDEQGLSISTRLWYGFRLGCSLRGIGW